MGVVYLAEQVGLKRRVALKFLKPELAASGPQRVRFQTESMTLARLQHPNIVQVFDSGTHQGQAYIVQEYVAGGSLDRELARQPQAARPAAELIATLALAVEHAHAQKIVHRDLKPANVLLTTGGIPKISDFGLAKQIDAEAESGQTQSGTILGSPSYMAPEQALGKRGEIGPAVDIYAVGAILYEMVTGRPPFLAASVMETLEQVRHSDPVPLRQLQPGLPRDLETICLKCLAKDPARRYATAAALADDLTRYLTGRPILARPASTLERLAKWVRRRPATAASLAVAMLAALALLAGGIIYEGRLRAALEQSRTSADLAREQKQNADARYRLARQTLKTMVGRLDDNSLYQTPRVKELKRLQLEDALGFYREVTKDRDDQDSTVRFDVAEANLQAGLSQYQLDRKAEGRAQVTQAMRLLERLVEEDPARAEYRVALARCYRTLGGDKTPTGSDNEPPGKNLGPEQLLKQAAGLLVALVHDYPENRDYHIELAMSQNGLGVFFHDRQQLGDAEPWFRHAVVTYRSLLDAASSVRDTDVRVKLAQSLQNLAVNIQGTDHWKEALDNYAESRRLLAEALQIEPRRDEATLALGTTLLNWGILCASTPALRKESENHLAEAIERLRPVVDREPSWTQARDLLQKSHGGMAQWLEGEGRHVDATRHWEQVVRLAEPGNQEHLRFFLALAHARAGDHRKAWELVEALEPSLDRLAVDYTYHLTVVCSVSLDAAARDPSLAAQRTVLCTRYGDQGAALLRRCLEKTPAAELTAKRQAWRQDKDLAPLLGRADVQSLLADSQPTPAVKPSAASMPRGSK